MTSITRRAALKSGVATVAAGAVAAPSVVHAEGDDALLLKLCAELKAANDRLKGAKDKTDEYIDAFCDTVLAPIERRIAATPASTLQGLREKFRILTGYIGPASFDEPTADETTFEELMWRSLGRDLDRLAKGDAA